MLDFYKNNMIAFFHENDSDSNEHTKRINMEFAKAIAKSK